MRMHHSRDRRPTRLALGDYYLIEGVNAAASTLFLLAMFFWTRARLDFSNTQNLWLGVVQGASYVLFSLWGGALAERVGYDRMIGRALAAAALLLPAMAIFPGQTVSFLVVAIYTAAMAVIWPSLEAAITVVPGRWRTPQRVAAYNVVWALAGTLGFFASGALFGWRADAVVLTPVALHVMQLLWLGCRVRRSAPVVAPSGTATSAPPTVAHPRRHPRFMHASRLGNMLGYFVVTSFGALTPHVGERLDLTSRQTIWMACVMLLTRGLSFLAFGRWEGWHYRWRWLIGSIVLLPATLAASFFCTQLAVVLAAQAIMGVLLGLIYSSSLFYSLDLSEDHGTHSGRHEAMIGVGILAGPLAGVAGARLFGGVAGAKLAILAVYAITAVAGLIMLCRSIQSGAAWRRHGKMCDMT
jgi:MFS family permease